MQVNLRRGDRRVSEQIGDHIDTGSGVDDVAAVGVSQLVRAAP